MEMKKSNSSKLHAIDYNARAHLLQVQLDTQYVCIRDVGTDSTFSLTRQ